METEIDSDGRTVWVNSIKGCCIGRFCKSSFEYHKDEECQQWDCEPGPTTLDHWSRFKDLMLKHHGVTVSDEYMPEFLKNTPGGTRTPN